MVGRKGNRSIKHFKILKAKKQMLKRYRHRILRKAESSLWRKETTLFTENLLSLRNYKYRSCGGRVEKKR